MSRRRATVIALSLVIVFTTAGVVWAQVSSSFDLSWSSLAGGGGRRASSNFLIQDILGWTGGESSSTDVQLGSGFWYGVALETTTPTETPTSILTPVPPTPTPTPTSVTGADGDGYEDDDSCARASSISTDGSKQTHDFHDEGDEDWIKFTTVANKTYVIETSNVGPDHDAVVFLHNQCDAPVLGSEDNAFGQTLRLEWHSTSATTYYLKLQQYDPGIFGEDTDYDISISVDSTPPSAPKSLRTAPDAQALLIQWKRSPELDVASYRIWFGTSSGIYSGVEQVEGRDTTYYELTGLTNGTRYYIAISALDRSGNESLKSAEISNIPAPAQDSTIPSVTVNQPASGDVYTTTLETLTISGMTQDQGENLSRVRVRNLSLAGVEGWDYSLTGNSDEFFVENLNLKVGENSIEVTVFDEADNQGTDSMTLHRIGETSGAAIIVAGHNDTFSLQTNINNAANYAYQVFRGAGFSDDDIYYLAPTAQDPDGDGNSEVDATSSPGNLQYAIETWAAGGERVGPGKPLFLYMMDHGFIESFCTDGCSSSGETTPGNLNTWLNTLETSTGADAINVVIEACHSGSFIDRVENVASSISKQGRVVIASTGRANNAYASAGGAYFSDAFFSCIMDSNSLKACYDQATTAVTLTGNNQTPWLDDNGDALSNPADGTLAQNRYIAASFGSFRPEIQSVSVNVSGVSGVLTAQVKRGFGELDIVWAAVYTPSFQEPNITTEYLGVPVVLLEPDPEEEGLYSATYPNGFIEEGTYRVVFYAQDQAGIHAQPELEVVGEQKVFLPLIQR